MYIRPLGHAPDRKMNPSDLAVFRQVAEWGKELGGYPTVSVTGSGATAFGLSYNQNTRTISGTPTGAGPYPVLITATDSFPQQPQVVARQFTVSFTGSSPTIAPT